MRSINFSDEANMALRNNLYTSIVYTVEKRQGKRWVHVFTGNLKDASTIYQRMIKAAPEKAWRVLAKVEEVTITHEHKPINED